MREVFSSAVTSAAIVVVLFLFTPGAIHSQGTPVALPDEEFIAAIESGDTTQWLKIQVMTDEQAKLLTKKRGIEVVLGFASDPVYCLYLNNLKTLNPTQAKALAKCKTSLCLDGLKDLPAEISKELVRYNGEYVPRLWYAQSLKGGQLLAWIGGVVTLNGLDSLSDETAKNLSKMLAYELQLNGVKQLSKVHAKHLAKSETNLLQLATVSVLAEDAAKDLSLYGGKLFMPRLNPESRAFVLKYGGELTGN